MTETPPTLADAREQFLALVADVRPELHRYCARLTGSVIDGEDIVARPSFVQGLLRAQPVGRGAAAPPVVVSNRAQRGARLLEEPREKNSSSPSPTSTRSRATKTNRIRQSCVRLWRAFWRYRSRNAARRHSLKDDAGALVGRDGRNHGNHESWPSKQRSFEAVKVARERAGRGRGRDVARRPRSVRDPLQRARLGRRASAGER